MFESVRKRVREGVENAWQTIASHGESGDKPWDHEANLYKRDMMMYSMQLEDNADAECKAEAIKKIGHLSYTGICRSFPAGYSHENRTWMCLPNLYQFFAQLGVYPPISIPFSIEKDPILPKLGAFYNNFHKMHPIFEFGLLRL